MSNNGNNNMDMGKKQLEQLDQLLERLQKELPVIKPYVGDGSDKAITPYKALYAHIRAIIDDLMNEPDPAAYFEKMQSMNEAVAGILIVIVPAAAGQVKQNMQSAYGQDFDPSALDDIIDSLNKSAANHTPTQPGQPPQNQNAQGQPQADNDPQEVIDMLELGKYAKPTIKPGDADPLNDVYNKYNQ